MTSQNLTWSDMLRCHETVTYHPSPEDPTHKTRFVQRAEITAVIGAWDKVRRKIEGFSLERFAQNADRGRTGFEEVLQRSRQAFGEERRKEEERRKRSDQALPTPSDPSGVSSDHQGNNEAEL